MRFWSGLHMRSLKSISEHWRSPRQVRADRIVQGNQREGTANDVEDLVEYGLAGNGARGILRHSLLLTRRVMKSSRKLFIPLAICAALVAGCGTDNAKAPPASTATTSKPAPPARIPAPKPKPAPTPKPAPEPAPEPAPAAPVTPPTPSPPRDLGPGQGTTGRCADGSITHAQGRPGACSHHGGLAN